MSNLTIGPPQQLTLDLTTPDTVELEIVGSDLLLSLVKSDTITLVSNPTSGMTLQLAVGQGPSGVSGGGGGGSGNIFHVLTGETITIGPTIENVSSYLIIDGDLIVEGIATLL
jgi:hypothetical protein